MARAHTPTPRTPVFDKSHVRGAQHTPKTPLLRNSGNDEFHTASFEQKVKLTPPLSRLTIGSPPTTSKKKKRSKQKAQDDVPNGIKELLRETKAATTAQIKKEDAASKSWPSWLYTSAAKAGEGLAIQIYLNFCRDFVWAWRTTANTSVGDQVACGTGAMLAGLVPLMAFYKYVLRRPFPLAQALIYIAGAAAAIGTWDIGQDLSEHGFIALGAAPLTAEYLSSIGAGVLESVTQYAVINLLSFLQAILKDSTERKNFLANPKPILLYVLKELGLNASIGAIPGAVWQLVFVACRENNVPVAAASALVATCVAICSPVTDRIIGKTINSCCKPPIVASDSPIHAGRTIAINIDSSEVTSLRSSHSSYKPTALRTILARG